MMARFNIFKADFTSIYDLYVAKAEKKNRTQSEVDEIILWFTGHTPASLKEQLTTDVDLESFINEAPLLNPNRLLIKGVVCGVRVEDLEDPLMREVRYLDKLIDELAKGKAMEKILRK
jgi:hypothetical protein